jgi:hypothetical protein
MATGALDANGIWIYGEDDSEPTFSGLLNKLGDSTSDAVGTLSTDIASLEERKLSGLVPVNPASVNHSGGSVTVSTNGTINFTGVTSLTLNDVFTSTYRNYRLVLDFTSSANGANATLQFRNNLTTLTGTNYAAGFPYLATGTWVVTGSGIGLTSTNLFVDTTEQNIVTADFLAPAIATLRTQFIGTFGRVRNVGIITGGYTSAAETDGFVLTMSTGTFTGSLAVYGYTN